MPTQNVYDVLRQREKQGGLMGKGVGRYVLIAAMIMCFVKATLNIILSIFVLNPSKSFPLVNVKESAEFYTYTPNWGAIAWTVFGIGLLTFLLGGVQFGGTLVFSIWPATRRLVAQAIKESRYVFFIWIGAVSVFLLVQLMITIASVGSMVLAMYKVGLVQESMPATEKALKTLIPIALFGGPFAIMEIIIGMVMSFFTTTDVYNYAQQWAATSQMMIGARGAIAQAAVMELGDWQEFVRDGFVQLPPGIAVKMASSIVDEAINGTKAAVSMLREWEQAMGGDVDHRTIMGGLESNNLMLGWEPGNVGGRPIIRRRRRPPGEGGVFQFLLPSGDSK